jgi:hypothetical protein
VGRPVEDDRPAPRVATPFPPAGDAAGAPRA